MVLLGIISHGVHWIILQSFPYFDLTGPPFVSGVVLLLINHYIAFSFFAGDFHPFSQVLGYFTMILWLVPFAFFISLSANENILPTSMPSTSEDNINLIPRRKRWGLLSFLTTAKESILPQRLNKSF